LRVALSPCLVAHIRPAAGSHRVRSALLRGAVLLLERCRRFWLGPYLIVRVVSSTIIMIHD
jgi:hypothetical protein